MIALYILGGLIAIIMLFGAGKLIFVTFPTLLEPKDGKDYAKKVVYSFLGLCSFFGIVYLFSYQPQYAFYVILIVVAVVAVKIFA